MNKIETKEAEPIEGIKLVDDSINSIKNLSLQNGLSNKQKSQ